MAIFKDTDRNPSDSNKTVFSLLKTRTQAEQLVEQLSAGGFALQDISVLLPDTQGTRDFAHEQNTKAPEGAAAGVGVGGAVGGTFGLLVGIGALAIPGLGMFIAAGPLMAALSGAAVGAAVGGVTGALVGMGIPEIEAKAYEGKIREGNVLVAVHVRDSKQIPLAKETFTRCGAEDPTVIGESGVPRQESKDSTSPHVRY